MSSVALSSVVGTGDHGNARARWRSLRAGSVVGEVYAIYRTRPEL
ncbi:MAG: hypothetical protein ACYC1I_04410 [Acidimicrobiales bacterium]